MHQLQSRVGDALASLSTIRDSIAHPNRVTRTTEDYVSDLKGLERDFFSKPVAPSSAEEVSPAKTEEAKVDEAAPKTATRPQLTDKTFNSEYAAKVRHRPKTAPFEVKLTPLPLGWEYVRLPPKVAANSTLSGLFSKVGSGPMPVYKTPEDNNPRKAVEAMKKAKEAAFIPKSKSTGATSESPAKAPPSEPVKLTGAPRVASLAGEVVAARPAAPAAKSKTGLFQERAFK